ncbi:uncharacterized WD repeat-containing protein C17D11.16-like [Phalaenopsis equestris]|uniref:uncharacterized WD repeat-containing protein C17D11.16-like n=1 Tax=Phalaenopsis equestris TaxID=78828 RepID=UPI0009E63B9D|nr:uncharacterized WD repeat-containing protein C17D11.16-like [Phalaenopsis equestris]
MISALCWVPKGASKIVPVVAEPPSKEEIEEFLQTGVLERKGDVDEEEDEYMDINDINASEEMDEVALAQAAAKALNQTQAGRESKDVQAVSVGIGELNMDAYDDEDDGIELFGSGIGDSYYPSNDMDPYLQNKGDDSDDDDDDDEIEDMTIKPTDSVIVCARNEDEVSHLEIWIFEESRDGDANMYVHHDVILPAFPLCTAWLDCNLKGGDKGKPFLNFLFLQRFAVRSLFSNIKLCCLDFRVWKSVVYRKDSHRDAVLGLAWNKEVRNVLASASADKLVKIWDVITGKCVATISHHTDKVSQENGVVQGFDIRVGSSDSSGGKPVFTLHAHDKAVSSISYNPSRPNLLATGSTDKTVKLWDLSNNQPSCVATRKPKAGSIFSIAFSEDSPFLLAIGGHKGKLKVWDIASEPGIAPSSDKSMNQREDPMAAA